MVGEEGECLNFSLMKTRTENVARVALCASGFAACLTLQGCLATRDWVAEQTNPLSARVSKNEARLAQAENQIGSLGGRVGGVETKLGGVEGKLGAVDAKTEQALNALANLKLERRVVIDIKDGANFQSDSANLPARTRKEITSALRDLKKDPSLLDGATVVVAGHTDDTGDQGYTSGAQMWWRAT